MTAAGGILAGARRVARGRVAAGHLKIGHRRVASQTRISRRTNANERNIPKQNRKQLMEEPVGGRRRRGAGCFFLQKKKPEDRYTLTPSGAPPLPT